MEYLRPSLINGLPVHALTGHERVNRYTVRFLNMLTPSVQYGRQLHQQLGRLSSRGDDDFAGNSFLKRTRKCAQKV